MARGTNRVRALAGAMFQSFRRTGIRGRPPQPRKILVLHELLLGDTLMLAPLLAALRHRYPPAEIFVASNPAYACLFSGKPYGAQVLPYSERLPDALAALAPSVDCDIAVLPGDNRHAIAARAIGARWVVGFAGGKPTWRNLAVDEYTEFPRQPEALAEIFMRLAGLEEDTGRNLRFQPADWPAPSFAAFELPPLPYAVLHVGAGSPLRLYQTPSNATAFETAINTMPAISVCVRDHVMAPCLRTKRSPCRAPCA